MRDEEGFDEWSDTYDESVKETEAAQKYPFAGYQTVLRTVYHKIDTEKQPSVLDFGFGTGKLTKKLYDSGCRISGNDFSIKMVETAQEKMPEAKLVQADFSKGLPQELRGENFDAVISTYAFHHLTDEQKAAFLRELLQYLKPQGKIIIGDVMFRTLAEREACREKSGDDWDSSEHYLVFDQLKPLFPAAVFQKISFCAGILTLSKESSCKGANHESL
ncbi:MAG: class I SAM-dependent methyltransferase [Oscillospiraceae bacterium]|nr:class I SAM-dependent methyltransferase [Oscillospiraceae bacterium]